MAEQLLASPTEQRRAAKHKAICNKYLSLSKKFPEAKPHRIFKTIADQMGMTIQGVRSITIKAGLYPTK